MKTKLFLVIAVLTNSVLLAAKVNYSNVGIDRKVLFTLNEKESLYQSGFEDANHFDIITSFVVDSTFNGDYYEPIYHYSFIVNGDRKCSMNNPDNICNFYYNDFSKCMYEYIGADGSVYVQDGNKSYGPYTKVLLKPRKYPYGNEYDYRTSFEHYKQGQFEFWYDDEHFVREDDGKIHKFEKRRSEYLSPNKKHQVTISNGNPLKALAINGKKYDLTNTIETYWKVNHWDYCNTTRIIGFGDSIGVDMSRNPQWFTTDCCIFDDGTCLYRIINTTEKDNFSYNYTNYDFYIKRDSTRLLAHLIVDHNLIENCDADMDDYYDKCCEEHTYYEYYDRISDTILRREVCDNSKKNECENMHILLDKTGNHHLVYNLEHKYAFIDDIKFETNFDVLPWSILYNEKENAFQWVCIEGKDVVFYSYSLK